MDTEIRSFLIGFRTTERMREADANRLAVLARSSGEVSSDTVAGSTIRAARHLAALRNVGRRVVVAAVVLALGVVSIHPARALTGVEVGSLITDPGLPLSAVVDQAVESGRSCVGLPHPATPTDSTRRGGRVPGATWARGTSRCIGSVCGWDLSDDRLDGTVEVMGGGCPRAGATSTSRSTCLGGIVSLVGATGRWLGSWTSFAPDDRLVMLEGAGAFKGLAFVGHWTDRGAASGRVIGLVTRHVGLVRLWPEWLP